MVAKLMVRETREMRLTPDHKDYPDADAALTAGKAMALNGSIVEFEVWTLRARYKRKLTLEKLK